MNFFITHSLWLSAFVLLVPTTLIAMAGPFVVRRFVPLRRLRTNNEVAGFKFATIGVLYAVLLAFAVIIVWEKFDKADNDVAKEASAAASIYRLSRGLDDAHGAAIRSAMNRYLDAAITQDWPAMQRGEGSAAATEAMTGAYSAAVRFHAVDTGEAIVVSEILRQLDQVTEARRSRLAAADGVVPDVIWAVLLAGAAITLAFTFFFGTENIIAQSLMTGALSILIFSGILTIVVIDRPFSGSVKVGPNALVHVLADFGK